MRYAWRNSVLKGSKVKEDQSDAYERRNHGESQRRYALAMIMELPLPLPLTGGWNNDTDFIQA